MSTVLAMQWHIIANHAPQPLLPCNRCGGIRAYRHSGKFRLNAQARRLDAWLIYRCTACDNVWNRPVFERRNVRDIDAATLRALQANDPMLVQRIAHDAQQLKRVAPRIEHGGGASVRKAVVGQEMHPCSRLEVTFEVDVPAPLRTDRLLATELCISRARLQALERDGRLCLPGARRRALRQPVTDGMRMTLELDGLDDGDAIARAARG